MKQLTSQPDDFAAFVGLDWADAKHDVCLQAADTVTSRVDLGELTRPI